VTLSIFDVSFIPPRRQVSELSLPVWQHFGRSGCPEQHSEHGE
jgi:hypothetical protein